MTFDLVARRDANLTRLFSGTDFPGALTAAGNRPPQMCQLNFMSFCAIEEGLPLKRS
jgi:hypothetical protein